MFEVRVGGISDSGSCLRILHALPDYFTEQACEDFADAVLMHPFWVAISNEAVVGFVLAERRHPRAAEITFAAVEPPQRGQGAGKQLVAAVFAAVMPTRPWVLRGESSWVQPTTTTSVDVRPKTSGE